MPKVSFFTKVWMETIDKKAAKERADYVLKPTNKYNKKAKKILELGVGIGAVLIHFSKKYAIYGLDVEKEYVDVCKKMMPKGKFIVSSMHNFKIDEKFDVIFSVWDSINFLKTFNQWKSTFKCVNSHLNQKGLFIFDMYTPKALKDFKDKEVISEKFSMGFTYDEAIVKNNALTWDYKIFERIKKGLYKLHEDKFTEFIYPIPRVKSALSKQFKILETKLMDEGRRVLFVCKKK